MSNLSQHRQALFCNDSQSIADYQKNMHTAVQAVTDWLKNDKMYTGGSIKQLRAEIAFQPSKEGLGLEDALKRSVELFLNKSLKVH
ncbi:MAG: aspartate aminotransferase family protein, partial [Moraxella osloensis]|nr:aspartate aminotransferase family protein [Moraxella osloensis]